MSYKLAFEERGVYCFFHDSLTTDDFINFNRDVSKISQFSEFKYQIINYINVVAFPLDCNAIRTVAERDAKLYKINPNIKVAIVANAEKIKGLAKVYKTYFEISGDDKSWDIKIFETGKDARKWINT